MVDTAATGQTPRIPEGYRAIPIHRPGEAPLRLCVLVRQTPDPALGPFVVLRDLPDAIVYLGCVTDTAGGIREWIELWVQNVDGLEASLPAHREAFSNSSLDDRWSKTAEDLHKLNPLTLLRTGWECSHPLPAFLDLTQGGPMFPGEKDAAGAWQLCREDGLLQAAQLPAYSTSLVRYWHQPAVGKESRFVPVVAAAPQNPATRPLAEVMGDGSQQVPFNPQGGLMLATDFYPIAYEDYVDLLGGKPWKGIDLGKKHFNLGGIYRTLENWEQVQQSGAHLFLGALGRRGRLPEAYHLKLQLLADALRLVRGFVQHQQLPFLNLAADSFRVKLEAVGSGLPFLWTAGCALVKPSQAFALPVAAGDFRYFIRSRAEGMSSYLPDALGGTLQGSASVRIRKIMPPDHGRTVLEGTLVLQERMAVSPHDLLWMRLPLPSGRLDLYGHVYTTEGLAQGEARFRTLPLELPEPALKALQAAEGVSFARSPFEIVPLLSSPCDLYSFGVLAVRTLLVDEEATLAVSLDEVLSLARQVAAEHKPDVPLGERIREVLERDERYAGSLGPHRLVREKIEPKEALQLFPADLWYDTLAAVVRLFPGMGPDSICKDYGDAPSLALETVFNQPLDQADKLLLRSRSLIVIDWNLNREIHSVLRGLMERHKGSEG